MVSDAIPLVPARRHYGGCALGLGALAVVAIALAVVAQSPPALRGGGVALALILVALCSGVSLLSALWAGLIAWPTERKRLQEARPATTGEVPSAGRSGTAAPLTVLVVGGLLVGILLWAFLNTVGLIGAPMLWLVVGTINLEVARRTQRVERAEHVTYYETAPAAPFRRSTVQEVFVQGLSSRPASRQVATARRRPSATAQKAKG